MEQKIVDCVIPFWSLKFLEISFFVFFCFEIDKNQNSQRNSNVDCRFDDQPIFASKVSKEAFWTGLSFYVKTIVINGVTVNHGWAFFKDQGEQKWTFESDEKGGTRWCYKKELNSIETVIWTMKSFPFMLKIFKLKLVSSTLFFAPWLFPSFLLENTSNQIHTYPNMELKIFIWNLIFL